jgi:hypothetical protein
VMALIDRLAALSDQEVAALSPLRRHVAKVGRRRRDARRPGSGADRS